ncbi:DUF4260 domain-containing protein [Bradyrhizobium sp. STM 3557]|uniref:DUF4260 domain-containing protein n=1 Tax=Bradyrhizobium sp. STM 3557 TaxID=578920 RepID=UPI00388FC534
MQDKMEAPAIGVTGGARLLLRLEGLALLAAMAALYAWRGTSWWLFAVLFFMPDLSFAGYLLGPRPGAIVYNAVHTTIVPGALLGLGLVLRQPLAIAVAIIWLAHIGFDRALGYGLKYPDGFGSTHLGRIGRAAA